MRLCLLQEEMNRGKPNWEHLNEDLHVLITVEDTRNRAEVKLKRAVEEVQRLLVPAVSTYQHSVLSDKYLHIVVVVRSSLVLYMYFARRVSSQ